MEILERLDKHYFEQGMTLPEYAGTTRNYRGFIKELMLSADPLESSVEKLKSLIAPLPAPVRATVNTEDWCGDWACNAPFLGELFSRSGIEMRIFRGSEFPALKKRYERDGDDHIPAVSLWDGEGNELIRWIEAPEKVSAMKDEWKAQHSEFMETYRSKDSDPEAKKAWPKMYRDFMELMAGWYRDGMWHEISAELIAALEDRR